MVAELVVALDTSAVEDALDAPPVDDPDVVPFPVVRADEMAAPVVESVPTGAAGTLTRDGTVTPLAAPAVLATAPDCVAMPSVPPVGEPPLEPLAVLEPTPAGM
jgi:hypothetical protein